MLAATSNLSATNPWATSSPASDATTIRFNGACGLLARLVQAQCTNRSSIEGDIEHGFERLDELKKQVAESVRQAADAANESGFFGFLSDIFGSDIAQIVGAVAAIAATIASYGAAAPLLVIVISEALQVAAKVGAELGLDPKICMVIAIASVAVGFCSGGGSGQAVGAAADAAREVALGAKIAQGSATIAGGSAKIVSAHYRAKQLDRQADAVKHQARKDATDLDMDDAFARLQRSLRAEHQEVAAASEIIGADLDIDTTLCNRI